MFDLNPRVPRRSQIALAIIKSTITSAAARCATADWCIRRTGAFNAAPTLIRNPAADNGIRSSRSFNSASASVLHDKDPAGSVIAEVGQGVACFDVVPAGAGGVFHGSAVHRRGRAEGCRPLTAGRIGRDRQNVSGLSGDIKRAGKRVGVAVLELERLPGAVCGGDGETIEGDIIRAVDSRSGSTRHFASYRIKSRR